ncbi:uncharacterized protein LOC141700060 [Apium graveolens]|uniref:uncharacterized protein LOC141700060 n=1 Tax=Apium graveolens TaxID=4045 RepID=UPI003D7B6528
MTCIKTILYSFLRDGEVFGDVRPQKGIRQGDPISPFLYILCVEGMTAIIRKYEECGMLHGGKIARGAPSISHFLFADDCYFFFRASVLEARIMQTILQRYEWVGETDTPGLYLGMPMCVGKNKAEVFGFLNERVGNKLKGWSNKELSKDGIRWASWEKLSASIHGGGLEVRNLKIFNIAMLAKQGWRILNKDNPLVSAIMKARYFPGTDFLNASLGSNLRNTRCSIMATQEAVKVGCRRRIRNGADIKDITVDSLIDMESGGWDYDIQRDIFNARDRELIMRVPIPIERKNES